MSTSKVVTRADLKAVLDEVLPAEAGLVTQYFEASATTINAGAVSNFAFDVTKSGYNALGVVAFDGYDGGVSVVSIVQNNATTITMWLKNITNSAISVKPRITVLYAPCGTRTLVGDVDYIVEQGTSGIWTYRKWNSGIAECWGSRYYDETTTCSSWGSLYYYAYKAQESYPTGLFNATPNLTYSLVYGGDNCWTYATTSSGSSSQTPQIGFIRPTTATTLRVTVAYHAIGRWK